MKSSKKKTRKKKQYSTEQLKEIDKVKLRNALKSAIRISFSRSNQYEIFVNSRKEEYYGPTVKGKIIRRIGVKCARCNNYYPAKDINVDHIKPIGHGVFDRLENVLEFYRLVYCDESNLQILCKGCHSSKTNDEGKVKSYKNAIF